MRDYYYCTVSEIPTHSHAREGNQETDSIAGHEVTP